MRMKTGEVGRGWLSVVTLSCLLFFPFSLPAQAPSERISTSPLETALLSSLKTPDWLDLSGVFRFRFEGRSGLGFLDGVDDGYGLTRARINIGVQPHPQVRFFFQGQDSRAPGIRPAASTGVFRDPVDLRQAFLEIGGSRNAPLVLTVGRQLLGYGDQKLVGPLEWANTARSFDAVKVALRTEVVNVDLFSASVVRTDPNRQINHPLDGDNLHGVHVQLNNSVEGVLIEPFLLWRTNPRVAGEGSIGDMDQYTAGVYSARNGAPGWQYVASAVKQWGDFAEATIDATFLSVLGGYQFDIEVRPRLFFEYNYASGDSNPTDGVQGSFDNIYPTAHIYYGYNDLVGLRNIKNLRLGSSVRAAGRVTLGLDFHAFWLAEPNDHLYNVLGTAPAVRTPDGGASDTKVGNELDFSASLPVGNTVTLLGGVGHMFPGPFLEANSPGDGNTFTYFSIDYRF